MEYATYFSGNLNNTIFSDIDMDSNGNIWLSGFIDDNTFDPTLPISSNAILQTSDIDNTTNYHGFIVKFSGQGDYLYSTFIQPFDYSGTSSGSSYWGVYLDLDVADNIYVGGYLELGGATAPPTVKGIVGTLNETSPISTLRDGPTYYKIGYVAKIPANLSQIEFVSTFPIEVGCSGGIVKVEVDDVKGNLHIITNAGNAWGPSSYYHPLTPGATSQDIYSSWNTELVYFVTTPDGATVLYGTTLMPEANDCLVNAPMFLTSNGEAYIIQSDEESGFATPSYRDPATGTQKFVYDDTRNGYQDITLMVYHDVVPNDNTITDFAPGNNTFCVGGLIYQNPGDGPILGSEVSYTSGDGSSPDHNLPDFILNGRTSVNVPFSHPSPPAADVTYQWQVSRDGGTTWEDIPGENLAVLKPLAESVAGTVLYRRNVISVAYCTVLSTSNEISATIAGNISLDIDVPNSPTYYCEGSTRDLGLTITGTSGNISWQWYDGFEPLPDNTEINPASGSGTAGSFIAEIPSTQNKDGIYRLVVTDGGGCKKEKLISISRLSAAAGNSPIMAMCPGTSPSVTLGPGATNADFDYSWTGPSGFTSTVANPTVTVVGDYFLQVKLTSDATFCVTGQTTVNVPAPTPHDASLIAIGDSEFCQSDGPATIGLSTAAPAGYTFQWSPGVNLDNQQAFSPNFDPGNLPFGITPIAEVEYTFSALRLSDGCIFETTKMVSDTALALANAGNDRASCGSDTFIFGRAETTGLYWEWEAVSTTFSGGLAALTSDAAFSIDGANVNLGTNKFAAVTTPDATSTCYDVLFVLRAAYVPFPVDCSTTDTVLLRVCPAASCNPCPDVVSDYEGTDGVCGSASSLITASTFDGFDLEWTTYSIDGVIQAAGTEPRGLFTNNGGIQGTALAATGPHPGEVIANLDDGTWGWAGANVVTYQVSSIGSVNGLSTDCSILVQVFSGQSSVSMPLIGIEDKSLCTFPAPGVEVGSSTNKAPYILSGVDYTQAPNSAFEWTWTELNGGTATISANGDSPFPTLNPSVSTSYLVTARDIATGCVARDTMDIGLVPIIANAGSDITGICENSLIQLGTPGQPNFTYSWSPASGLNFPIATPNSTVAQPYLIVPDAPAGITYTLIATETTTACQATDDVIITTDTDPPTAMLNRTSTICEGAVAVNFGNELGSSYQWAVFSGGGNLAWFNDVTDSRPLVTIPPGTPAGTYVFQITKTKGDCGFTTALYTITVTAPPIVDLGIDITGSCATPYPSISTTQESGVFYLWSPLTNLYRDDAGANDIRTSYSALSYIAYPGASGEDVTYTLYAERNGCTVTDEITILAATALVVNAGGDSYYCPDSAPLNLGATNTGISHTWTVKSFSNNDLAGDNDLVVPSPAEEATILAYLNSTNIPTPTFSQVARTPVFMFIP